MNIFPYIINNQYFNIEAIISNALYLQRKLGNVYNNSFLFPSPFLAQVQIPPYYIKEENKTNQIEIGDNFIKKNRKKIYKVIYPDQVPIFTNIENDNIINVEEPENILFKRKERQPRKYNKDNIRKKIKRVFFNYIIIQKLNLKLKSIGSILYFTRFPQSFVGDIFKQANKEYLNKKLREFFENKNLINPKNDIDLKNFEHNLKVIRSADVTENEELQKILDMKYCELFQEYINSDEFKIKVINKLKKKEKSEDYIKKYEYLSRHFMDFFSK